MEKNNLFCCDYCGCNEFVKKQSVWVCWNCGRRFRYKTNNNNNTNREEINLGEKVEAAEFVDKERVSAFKEYMNEEIPNPYLNKEEHDPFRKLKCVLELAYDQCANGKGKERHNPEGTIPFEDQPIMETTRAHGLGHSTGQAEKKLREAHNLIGLRGYDAAINEILGAIVYSAAAVLYLQEERDKNKSTKTLSGLLKEGPTNE
jgi:hypothetical protein